MTPADLEQRCAGRKGGDLLTITVAQARLLIGTLANTDLPEPAHYAGGYRTPPADHAAPGPRTEWGIDVCRIRPARTLPAYAHGILGPWPTRSDALNGLYGARIPTDALVHRTVTAWTTEGPPA